MLNTIKHTAIIALVAGATALAAPSSYATSKTATFDVTLTVQDDCSIAANPMDFGTTGMMGKNIDQASTLAVTCTAGTPYNVALDAGTAADSTIASRKMANAGGTASIDYNLYSDVARTQAWGQTVGTDTVSGTGNGDAQSINVYGRVPAQTTPAAGTYSSTVTATVIF
jgi:spore coat protein U-like protein